MAQPKKTKEQFILDSKKIWGDNTYDYSKVYYQGSQKKCTFICVKHNVEFQQTPTQHLHGACGCKQCQKEKLSKSPKQFLEDALKIHGNKYDYSKAEYKSNKEKVCIICPEHGEFWQLPSAHTRGQGCPHCERDRRSKTSEEFIKEAKQIHGDRYDYSKVKYINRNTPVTIICPTHGEFEQIPSNHLQGKGCPKCSKNYQYGTKKFIEKAQEVHNNKYDYSKVQYKTAKTPVTIICKKHGEFEQFPDVHLRGCGCPKCGKESMAQKQTLTQEEFIKRILEIHRDKYDFSKTIYKDSYSKVIVTCKEHGDFEIWPQTLLRGAGCSKCALKSQTKLYEKLKKSFPNEEILFEVGKEIVPWLDLQRFDIYFPKYNIAIEYNGQQHYIPIEYFGGTLGYENQKERDELKRKKCKENNCFLIEFPYNYDDKIYNNKIKEINEHIQST